MISAVDTNVLIDVLADNPRHATHSIATLRAAQARGPLVICELVQAEIARYFDTLDQLRKMLGLLNIAAEPIGDEACHAAGQAFLRFRARGGTRDRILADFVIGAHAQVRCSQLITRDRGFYRDYFPKLVVNDPTH